MLRRTLFFFMLQGIAQSLPAQDALQTFEEKYAQPAVVNEEMVSPEVEKQDFSEEQMNHLQAKLDDLEKNVSQLSKNIVALQAELADGADDGEKLTVIIDFTKLEDYVYQDINLKIDGYPLLVPSGRDSLLPKEARWTLFHGPMKKGRHRLDIAISLSAKKNISSAEDQLFQQIMQQVSSSFSFSSMAEQKSNIWILEVSSGESSSQPVMLNFFVEKG